MPDPKSSLSEHTLSKHTLSTDTKRQGVYVHLPWCAHRCHYCSFNVHIVKDRPETAYTQAVLEQWRGLKQHYGGVSTLYFGGGTPSLHPANQIQTIIRELAPTSEVTLEANPGSTSLHKLPRWRAAGVTRLSLGLQTFSARYARFLQRKHTAAQAQELMAAVARAGFESWSADLIFALPGQSLRELDQDLDQLLAADVPHVSLYGLTAHPDTHLARAVDAGRITLPEDEAWEEAYLHIVARLAAEGLHRYEVSNFARPGHRGLHNQSYWRAQPYVGLGAGAHGCLNDGTRTLGASDPELYIDAPLQMSWEPSSPTQRALDLILSTLRHEQGVPLSELQELGFTLDYHALRYHIDRHMLLREPEFLRLGPRAWTLADGLTASVAGALSPAST